MAAAQPVATVVLEGLRHPRVDADLVDSEREPTSEEWSSALGDMQVTRSFLKHLFGLSKKGSYIFSRKWCTLAYDRERCAWKIYVPSADPKTYQLAINRKVCEPGATYRVRDGDRLTWPNGSSATVGELATLAGVGKDDRCWDVVAAPGPADLRFQFCPCPTKAGHKGKHAPMHLRPEDFGAKLQALFQGQRATA